MLSNLFKLYIFFLPLGTFINIETSGIGNVVKYMSLNIAMLGCIYIFLQRKTLNLNGGVIIFARQYAFMVTYSVLAAIVLSFVLTYQPESPLSCILSDIVLYFEMLLSIYFVQYCLTHGSSFRDIYKALDWQIGVSIIFGLFQLMAVSGIGAAVSAYEGLSSILKIAPLQMLITMERGVTIFGAEPSSLTTYCFLTVPYILCKCFMDRTRRRKYYIISLVAFITLFVASNSTQNLVVFFVLVLSFLVLRLKKSLYSLLMTGAFVAGLVMAIFMCMDNVKSSSAVMADHRSLDYVIFGKFQDRDNHSTQMRASTMINDMKIFASNIIYGVGDGCQGFWYEKNVPAWCLQSKEVNDIIAKGVIPNGGGAFFPCYLSAYGLIGIIVLLGFVGRYKKVIRYSSIRYDEKIHMIYQLSMIILLLSCWYTVTLREVPVAIFIVALPVCCSQMPIKLIKKYHDESLCR